MKHEYHTLLPVHMQEFLITAAFTENIEAIDAAVKQLNLVAPYKFQNESTEKLRKFYHEPRQNVPNDGFVVAFKGLR